MPRFAVLCLVVTSAELLATGESSLVNVNKVRLRTALYHDWRDDVEDVFDALELRLSGMVAALLSESVSPTGT